MHSVKVWSLTLVFALVACEPLNDERFTGMASENSVASISKGRQPQAEELANKVAREADEHRRASERPQREHPQPAKASDLNRSENESENESDSPNKAPEQFTVKLDTTKGDILIDVTRNWAPRGADRFYELVKAGYYSNCAFFRVLDGFMAQTGINGDPKVNNQWRTKRIQDDPVEQSNKRGMVSFAMAGPNSRTTQFFINYSDNGRLDGMGFSPFGKVRNMTAVDALYSEYGEGAPRGNGPNQAQIQSEGNAYLKAQFPNLDYIQTARIVE